MLGRLARPLSIIVLGAGTAGLSAALALAREGHRVTLVERDEVVVNDPLDALSWERRGISHFLQPHAFGPRGRKELRALLPDVYASLLDAGAWDLDVRPKIPGPLRPDDEEFAYLAARRPVIEWALRRAVLAASAIRTIGGVRATGLVGQRGAPLRVLGVETAQGPIMGDLVIDAMGRRSPAQSWIESLGGQPMRERATDCGIIYYSRYYRVRPGATLPDGPWLPGPRGDLGYGAFSSFPGDNGTFAAVLGIPPGDRELKVLRNEPAFDAALQLLPALFSWTNPDIAEPITGVLPMGSLQNTIRASVDGGPAALGVISVADAVCHTDPALALGLSFSLIHAGALADAVRGSGSDVGHVAAAFDAATREEMEERFGFASAIDDARSRLWAGEPVDFAHRNGAYSLFSLYAGSAVALVDPDVFRVVVRRNTLLDPLGVLDGDVPMQDTIEASFAALMAKPRPRPGPTREALLAAIAAAGGGSSGSPTLTGPAR